MPPWKAMVSKFVTLLYALSPDTSAILKFWAVTSTNAGSRGQSFAFWSKISTDVTMFVLTPQQIWAFTHARPDISLPYFSLYHWTKRDVEKPDESTANFVSTAVRGRLA